MPVAVSGRAAVAMGCSQPRHGPPAQSPTDVRLDWLSTRRQIAGARHFLILAVRRDSGRGGDRAERRVALGGAEVCRAPTARGESQV